MKTRIRVAVIDDGICPKMFAPILVESVVVTDNLSIESYAAPGISHGTICANVIYKYYPDLDFYSIKILSDEMTGKPEKLYRALDWCIERGIEVAHLSIGSHLAKDFVGIRHKVNELTGKGLIIVCAAHNEDFLTYPAALSNVIGVKRDKKGELSESEFRLNASLIDGVEFTAYAQHKITFAGTEKTCSDSNSYAAPMMTALTCKLINAEQFHNLSVVTVQPASPSQTARHGLSYSPSRH